MRNNKGENFVTGILIVAIIIIFSVTTYFCLDIFGIIEVPEQYSLVNLLGSKIELSTVAESLENIIQEEAEKRKKIVIEETNTTYSNVEPPTFENLYSGSEENTNNTIQYKTNVENEFYFSQLDIYGKLIYSELYKNIENLKTGTYTVNYGVTFNDLLHEENGAEILENDFQVAVNALIFDKPEVFFLDITKMYLFTEITSFGPKKTYRISIGPNNGISYLSSAFPNEESVRNYENELDKIANNIVTEQESYKQIKQVHDYIVENIEYDSTVSKANIYNIYGALINREAVCEGYAKAFKYIMDKLNIPCLIACGVGLNSKGQTESHAWNYVRVYGTWYAVDTTWDDPVIVGGGSATYDMRYQYFLKGSNDFFKDHTEDGNLIGTFTFKYPTISTENYKR